MWKEFRDFIARGSVIDLAVGVIIGSAFTSIVKSLVSDLINPFIGLFLGGVDFSGMAIKVGNASFRYGSFINAIINFLIIAFIVFMIVRTINKFMPRKANTSTPTTTETYLKEIRDLLAKNNHI